MVFKLIKNNADVLKKNKNLEGIMQKEKSNIVYMLQLSIYDDNIGNNHDVLVGEWHYNDVFTSIEKAVKVGKKELLRKLKELKSQIFRDAKIDEIIESALASYEFYVYEFDPDVKRSRVMPYIKWDDYACWDFDYKGKLRFREERKTYIKDGEPEVSWREVNPGDEKEEAGTKFKAGDFVMINSRWLLDDNDLVYIIHNCPGNKSEWAEKHPYREWENRYSVSSIDNHGLYVNTFSHEMNIRPYEGVVPADHPLQLLRMYITGEVAINYDVWSDIQDQEIVFDCSYNKKSWRDIPRLYEQFTKINSGQQN